MKYVTISLQTAVSAVSISLLLSLPFYAEAHHNCEKYTPKIDKIKAKMRQGYTVRQGERLKKKLTKLQDKRFNCERSLHRKRSTIKEAP